jgi:pepF/M3 family oligoendopeptidase
MNSIPPRWDLSNVYRGLESDELKHAFQSYEKQIGDLEELLTQRAGAYTQASTGELSAQVGEVIDCFNSAYELKATIEPYLFSFVSTDSHDYLARSRLSEFELINVRMGQLSVRFRLWIGSLASVLEELIAAGQTAQDHAFALREAAEQAQYLMSEAEESLAAELDLSGANAWNKLQSTVSSQVVVDFELDGEVQKLPLPAVINLHSHPSEPVRRRAYQAELQALESAREPLAACLNGVKGVANTLNKRRGRQDALHSAIDGARIDRPTLEAMLAAMHDSFPTMRRYFRKKASRLGKEKLPWWDLYAPVGETSQTFTFDEARDFIVERFAGFSPDLEALARRAFDNRWIDAEQREGKQGGAFCMALAGVKESRILCNFDGSLDQVSTIAHELGHAFHNDCMFRAGKSMLQRVTPMTLAETASIMCETIVMNSLLETVASPAEELAILETMLIGAGQVIVDIYSRYLFESEVFERRRKAELSADDFCEIMERAQRATYGDGLDEAHLHRYMWAWKPHYYESDRSFYNFPYTFGMLFGIGLYAIYQQSGPRSGAQFAPDYQRLLASTGEANAADLAARFGIDICQRKFWDQSLAVIARHVERYCEL